jgi:hypothetical protein
VIAFQQDHERKKRQKFTHRENNIREKRNRRICIANDSKSSFKGRITNKSEERHKRGGKKNTARRLNLKDQEEEKRRTSFRQRNNRNKEDREGQKKTNCERKEEEKLPNKEKNQAKKQDKQKLQSRGIAGGKDGKEKERKKNWKMVSMLKGDRKFSAPKKR